MPSLPGEVANTYSFLATQFLWVIPTRLCAYTEVILSMDDFNSTCRETSDPLSMFSITRPNCADRAEEGTWPMKTPRTWITYGLLPLRIMSISRISDVLVLCAFSWIVSTSQPCFVSAARNLYFCLSNYLPIIIMEQFNGHIAAPPSMSGFVDLSKTSRANHFPVDQAGIFNEDRSWTAGKRHNSLEMEMIDSLSMKTRNKEGLSLQNILFLLLLGHVSIKTLFSGHLPVHIAENNRSRKWSFVKFGGWNKAFTFWTWDIWKADWSILEQRANIKLNPNH